jgi:hypothetical protein
MTVALPNILTIGELASASSEAWVALTLALRITKLINFQMFKYFYFAVFTLEIMLSALTGATQVP